MKIFVNEKLLNFKIEEEQNLFEVVEAIKKWGEDNNLYIKEILFQGNSFYSNKEEFKKIDLESVEEIYFYLIPPHELALASLSDCLAFFENLSKSEDQYKNPSGLLELFQWVYNIVSKSKVILGLDFNQNLGATSVNKELIKFNNFITQFSEKIKNSSTEEIKNFVESNLKFEIWTNLLSGIIVQAQESIKQQNNKLISKEELIKKFKSNQMELPEIIKQIETITDFLHSGNDAKGMMMLENIGNVLASLIQDFQVAEQVLSLRYTDINIDEKTVSDELISLTDVLTQIVDSFKNNDIVLLCDLLEYELSPKIEILSSIIEILLNKINTEYN